MDKGPRPRGIDPTVEFPELKGISVYQDRYPLQVVSEEGMADIEKEARERIGT
ncbi:hypothetical protein L208DRAFT_1406684 [Tricholoma matsutake]|nr:hypothetical protein L208DRAFT_1406684 [Tricholoma matsutake 945]